MHVILHISNFNISSLDKLIDNFKNFEIFHICKDIKVIDLIWLDDLYTNIKDISGALIRLFSEWQYHMVKCDILYTVMSVFIKEKQISYSIR